MRNYTLIALINFTDKYDETIKYKANERITVDEERALELLSSKTPVARYVSREEDNSLEKLELQVKELTEEKTSLELQVKELTEEIQSLTKKSTKKAESAE